MSVTATGASRILSGRHGRLATFALAVLHVLVAAVVIVGLYRGAPRSSSRGRR